MESVSSAADLMKEKLLCRQDRMALSTFLHSAPGPSMNKTLIAMTPLFLAFSLNTAFAQSQSLSKPSKSHEQMRQEMKAAERRYQEQPNLLCPQGQSKCAAQTNSKRSSGAGYSK